MNERGFSLLEVMVTVVIVGLVIGLVGANFTGLRRITTRYNENVAFGEQYLIFLLKFEEDFYQAEIMANQDLGMLDNLMFQSDTNQDGDFDDPGERISYRWNSKEKRIDRKSGEGSFQAFLDGVNRFNWDRISTSPVCYHMELVGIFNDRAKAIDYCRPLIK